MCMHASSIDINYLLMAKGMHTQGPASLCKWTFFTKLKKKHVVMFANVGPSTALSFKETEINYFDTCAVIIDYMTIYYCIIEFSTYNQRLNNMCMSIKLLSNLMLRSTQTNQQTVYFEFIYFFPSKNTTVSFNILTNESRN